MRIDPMSVSYTHLGSLPGALYHTGKYDIRVVLPLYGEIEQCWREQMQFIGSRQVELAWREQYCGLFRLEKDGVIYYFVDNEYYFQRNNGLYGSVSYTHLV